VHRKKFFSDHRPTLRAATTVRLLEDLFWKSGQFRKITEKFTNRYYHPNHRAAVAAFSCFILFSESASETIGALSFLTQESRFFRSDKRIAFFQPRSAKFFILSRSNPSKFSLYNKTLIFVIFDVRQLAKSSSFEIFKQTPLSINEFAKKENLIISIGGS